MISMKFALLSFPDLPTNTNRPPKKVEPKDFMVASNEEIIEDLLCKYGGNTSLTTDCRELLTRNRKRFLKGYDILYVTNLQLPIAFNSFFLEQLCCSCSVIPSSKQS